MIEMAYMIEIVPDKVVEIILHGIGDASRTGVKTHK
jgi:hypothetical protein